MENGKVLSNQNSMWSISEFGMIIFTKIKDFCCIKCVKKVQMAK